MDRDGAKEVFKYLMALYPSRFSRLTDETIKIVLDDFVESFGGYENAEVMEAVKDWHRIHNTAPTVADLIPIAHEKSDIRRHSEEITQEEFDTPTTYSKYFEDNEGYGYALNSKTGEYECIWKPYWTAERTTHIKGEAVALPARQKSKVLRSHGITWEG